MHGKSVDRWFSKSGSSFPRIDLAESCMFPLLQRKESPFTSSMQSSNGKQTSFFHLDDLKSILQRHTEKILRFSQRGFKMLSQCGWGCIHPSGKFPINFGNVPIHDDEMIRLRKKQSSLCLL